MRAKRVAVALLAACLALGAGSTVAFADGGGGTFHFNPTPSPSPRPTQSQAGSSGGGPAHTTVATCSLYATSSQFGMECITGRGTGRAETVRQILAGDPVPSCSSGDLPDLGWDTPLSTADATSLYDLPAVTGEGYYVHSCLTGVALDSSLYDQPDLQLNQSVKVFPVGTPNCPPPAKPATKKNAKGEKGKAASAASPAPVATCIQTLTARQRTVVSAVSDRDGQIPGIVLTTEPSTTVRTGEPVAYVDAGTGGNRITQTPRYRVGGVTMWATMTAFKIRPYGPGTSPVQSCDGTARVQPDDTPATMPRACWWAYPTGSGDQPNQTYPFRAEADWTVYYADGAGTHSFASFQKYDDLQLPVLDIQALVIN